MTVEYLRRAEWEVRPVYFDVARWLIRTYHSAGGCSNTAVYLHGLFKRGDIFEWQCQGVTWWMPPIRQAAISANPEDWRGVLALSRLVIHPEAPKNSASFLVSRSMRLLNRKRWPVLLTYVESHHAGTTFISTNWQYVGDTEPQRVYTKDGRVVSRRAGPDHNRNHAQMLEAGCTLAGHVVRKKFIHKEEHETNSSLERV